ncbi:hypothetical protein AXF42_Ash011783 [Apostasia shenzhenica]|uniref:Uncharacterized protein n=1 Tax=Apostasia shenzhenica TaxID=1088818 RepID=A0A2H9ZUX5_9ASPA|nr:hypothetical protein AXF42_Ash011783 [Apostasia shenzhenica]
MNSLKDELAKEERRDAQDILAPAYDDPEVFDVASSSGSWMEGIQHFLQIGELPTDRLQARKLRVKCGKVRPITRAIMQTVLLLTLGEVRSQGGLKDHPRIDSLCKSCAEILLAEHPQRC